MGWVSSQGGPSSFRSYALYFFFLDGGEFSLASMGGGAAVWPASSGSSTSGAIGRNCNDVSSSSSSELQNAPT